MNSAGENRVQARVGVWALGVLLLKLALPYCHAQTDFPINMVQSVDDQMSFNANDQRAEQQVIDDTFDTELPDTDLETGLPLKVLLTPFHWGRLSLLSFSAYEGYNSNPEFQRTPLGAYVTSLSALAMYSAKFSGWQMNLQYRPFVWITSQATLKSFAAASADIRTVRRINSQWHWTLGDHFRYSPTHSTEQVSGFIIDPSGGFSIGNAFLSSGRNALVNGIAATVSDHYSEHSSLTFRANQTFTHLSTYLSGDLPNDVPSQQAFSFSSGANWRNQYTTSSAANLEYTYRLQRASATAQGDVQSHTASVGWSHRFNRTLGMSGSGGPAWSLYGQSKTGLGRTTVHGSLSFSEQFRKTVIVESFARSDSFSGEISGGFHNRFDLAAHREITSRLRCSGSASYVQQQNAGQRNTDGKLASAEARYFLSRNWAIFAQIRYLKIAGNERITAPEKSIIAGIHWSWVPDKP